MIILIGISGAGKSIQGGMLEGYKWISIGEVLRKKLEGEQKESIKFGNLLSDDQVISIVEMVLKSNSNLDRVVIDGFPRTEKQARWLVEQVAKKELNIEVIYFIHASEGVVINRLLERGREDDTLEIIKKRFDIFYAQINPIMRILKEASIRIVDINGDNSPDKVHQEIINNL